MTNRLPTALSWEPGLDHNQHAEWADAVANGLASLGVLRDGERITLLHAWNCAKYVTGAACDCTPTLVYEGPHEPERALKRRQIR